MTILSPLTTIVLSKEITVAVPWGGMLVLAIVLAASVGVFVVLVQRETTRRRWVAMGEWASERRMKVLDESAPPPDAIASALPAEVRPRHELALVGERTALLKLSTDPPTTSKEPSARWHLLVRTLAAPWPATGLRPAAHVSSVIDLLALSSYPSLVDTTRFMIFGTTGAAARALADSPAAGLLPPDIGLLLNADKLILDFSTRPFDEIEFGRMIAVADQLAGVLGGE